MLKAVHFGPVSCNNTEIDATQGVYKRQNTKNEITLAFEEKNTTLDDNKIDSESSLVAEASIPLNIAIEDTTTSLATRPAKSAHTIAQFPKPNGEKIGARSFPMHSSMLAC